MALLISRRILRSFGSSSASSRRSYSSITCPSLYTTHDLYNHVLRDSFLSADSIGMFKGGPSVLSCRKLSTILTPESSEGAFPSDLLSAKRVVTSERKIGLYEDLAIPVTNFHNEDKGFMVLAGDVLMCLSGRTLFIELYFGSLQNDSREHIQQKLLVRSVEPGESHGSRRVLVEQGTDHYEAPRYNDLIGETKHGPKPRSHAIKLNKKVRRLGLKIALTAHAAEGKLLVFEDLEVPTHKTKNIVNYVNQMENAKKLLLVDGGPIGENLKLATQNLHYVNVLPSIGLNVYGILQHDTLVMSRDAVNRIVERMHAPINR